MNTSYFARSSKHPNAVSISIITPFWYKGRVYKKLAPPYPIVKKYKIDKDAKSFIQVYESEVLNKLDPQKVYSELGANAILLCYEVPGDFCHRQEVARWFHKHLGILVEELK